MSFLKILCLAAAMIFTGSFAHADISSAIRECINDSNEDMSKTRVDGTGDTIVMISCSGDSAQALYEAVRFYAKEWGPSESDTHVKRMVRSFGNLRVPSECLRSFQDSSGRGIDIYTCFLGIDLNNAVVKAM